jgi:beta-lactamase regulating signal transducer with metallopeptidase domain
MEEVKKDSRPVFGFAALLIWFFGWMFLSIRILLGLFGTFRLTREGKDIQDSLWKRLLQRFLATVFLRKKINLLSHDKTMVPLTWGIFKPVVMMPEESKSWSENQRSTALYHELSHIKRGDYLVMILARISRAIYWFNPLSWIVLRMIKKEQEKACDELVLKAGIKPSTYAENLLYIRNSISGHWNPPATVLGVMNKSHLNDRLTTILKQRFNLKEVQMKTKILLSVLAILSISFIGLARPGNSSGSHAEAGSPENATVMASIDSEEAPIVSQDQDKKEQKKKVKKEVKKEDKEKEKTTLVWTTKEGEKRTHEIIIDKDDPKKIIFITSPHGEHDKDMKGTWTIKADKLHLSEDVKKIELDKGTVIYITKDDKEGVKVIELESPYIQIKKAVKVPDHVAVDVHVSPHVEVHPKVHVVVDINVYEKLIKKIKEKLAKLKEQDLDSAAKEVELEGIEKTLEELRKALENKSEKTEYVDVSIRHKDSHSYRIKTKDIHIDGEKLHLAVKIGDDKGAFSLIYHAEFDIAQKEAYEKAIKKLEGNLPEGYDLESTFDEEKGTLLLKITSEKEETASKEATKKLIEEFKKDLEKIKN